MLRVKRKSEGQGMQVAKPISMASGPSVWHPAFWGYLMNLMVMG